MLAYSNLASGLSDVLYSFLVVDFTLLRSTFPDARIVIVTQYGDEHLRAAAREAGACGYVLKENLLELRELITNFKPAG